MDYFQDMNKFIFILMLCPLLSFGQTKRDSIYANDIYHEYTIGGNHQIIPSKTVVDMYCGRMRVTMPEGPVKFRISCGSSKTSENNPLFVLNDCVIEDFKLTSINPADIESINVIKNASAIEKYGPQAKYGVILIKLRPSVTHPTTKVGTLILILKP